MDTEKEVRVGERGLDERDEYRTWWHTCPASSKSYPRALKLCEWIHSFWENSLSSCLSLASEGIQLPHSCWKGRSDTGIRSGGWKDTLGEAHGHSSRACKLPRLYPDEGYWDISSAIPYAWKWHPVYCEIYLKSATNMFIWVRIKSRITYI